MLRPDDPYNQGIGTPYLGNMNLGQVPVDNMQVAEAINYGVLPGATEAFTPEWQSGATSNLGVKEWMKQTPNPTRGDFIDAIQSGTFGAATPGAFKENVGSLFGDVNLNKKRSMFNVDPSLIGTNDATWRQSIDIDKDALEQEALESLPEGFWKDDDQASLDDADFYNEYGYPKTAFNPWAIGKGIAAVGGKVIPKELIQMWKMNNAAEAAAKGGKKVKSILGGVLTGGAAQASANAAAAGQRREGRGGTHMSRSRDQGGLGISQSQAQAVSDANRAAGMSGWGLARGGRASYFDGGLLSLWPR
jgi:hypothetical protein